MLMFQIGFSNSKFDQDLNHLNTSKVSTLNSWMRGNAIFGTVNGNVSGLDMSNVSTFLYAFRDTNANPDIQTWTYPASWGGGLMMRNADSFDQNLATMDLSNCTTLAQFMLQCTGLSAANYDATLIGWNGQTLIGGYAVDMGGSTYTKTQVDSGTTDGTTANKLVDSTQTDFLTTVAVNDIVHNTTDDTYAKVTNVDSNTILSLNADIMVSGETYQIETSAAVKAKENMINSDGLTFTDGGGV
jgi:hypothetical protein